MKTLLTTVSLIIALSTTQAQTYTIAGNAANTSTPTLPNSYRLTSNQNNIAGAVWSNTMVDLNSNSFMINYDLYLGNNDIGGDGAAFVIQGNTPTTTMIGNNGEGLGFGIGTSCYASAASANCANNFSTSLAIEFDTYRNTNDPIFDHVALVQNGDTRGTRGFPLLAPAVQMHATKANVEDSIRYSVMITWDHVSKVLAIDFDGSRRITYTNDIVNTIFNNNANIFWGITGSTGGSKNLQEVSNLSVVYFGPLPVQMSSFKIAKTEKNYASLNWVTASERNNDFFTVERSEDGKSFAEVAKVKGAGNSSSSLSYNSLDVAPLLGISYYRIKQTDFDGKFSYSTVLSFENGKALSTISKFVLYPVPASSELNIDLNSTKEETATIIVFDISGKKVIHTNFDLISGNNTINLDLNNLTTGTFMVQLIDSFGKTMEVKQFNKQN